MVCTTFLSRSDVLDLPEGTPTNSPMNRQPFALPEGAHRSRNDRNAAGAAAWQCVAMASVLSLGACATLFAPGPDTVHIRTDPPGAEVLLDGLTVGQTPTHVAVSRRARGNISLRHPAHPNVDTHLTTTLNGPVLINVLFPGLLGILVDAAGGNCTRWVSPDVIRLPPARPSTESREHTVVANAAAAPEAPEKATAAPNPTAPDTASLQPTNQTTSRAKAREEQKQQPAAADPIPNTGFFVTSTGFGLFAASEGAIAATSLDEIAPARGALPSVRKAPGKTAFLALARDVPVASTLVYFLDRSGSLAEGSVLDSAIDSGTIRLSARGYGPLPGAAIVDRRGNVVGSAVAPRPTTGEGAVEILAVSCVSLQDLLRTCPTVTRPMPATSIQERSLQQLETMLKAATQSTEGHK